MNQGMCTCAVHCTISSYHESLCCYANACSCYCHGKIKLFLDDDRQEPDNWLRTYSVQQSIYWLRSRRVTHISLDNDLGEGKLEGYKVLDWLENEMYADKTFPIPIINIHSASMNPTLYMKYAAFTILNIRK